MNLELKDRYINKNPLKKNSKKSNHINEIYSNGIDDQTKKVRDKAFYHHLNHFPGLPRAPGLS